MDYLAHRDSRRVRSHLVVDNRVMEAKLSAGSKELSIPGVGLRYYQEDK